MTVITFPQKLYATRHNFNDYATDDMRYGDISETRLKKEFGFTNISNVVDPWTMTRLTAFNNPQSRFFSAYGDSRRGGTLSAEECARLLFAEMQFTSLPYACIGPWKYLINRMLKHFQQSTGMPFSDMQLNEAYKAQIVDDNSRNSTRLAIQQEINDHLDYDRKGYPEGRLTKITEIIASRILPKFDSVIMDKINGLGITIHDVYATRIDILSLEVDELNWRAKIKYTGQDHFGLDSEDIRKWKFNQFQFFKIWFILQRYNRFGFRPFFTNLEAVVDIGGKR